VTISARKSLDAFGCEAKRKPLIALADFPLNAPFEAKDEPL